MPSTGTESLFFRLQVFSCVPAWCSSWLLYNVLYSIIIFFVYKPPEAVYNPTPLHLFFILSSRVPFSTHPLRFNWNANPTLCCTSKDPFSQRKYRRHTVLSINIVATKQVQGISSGSVYSLISGHLILPTRSATDVREVWFHVVVIVLNFVTEAADQDEHSLQMDCIRPR